MEFGLGWSSAPLTTTCTPHSIATIDGVHRYVVRLRVIGDVDCGFDKLMKGAHMRGLVLFVAGVLVGVAVQATSAQNQPGNQPGNRVNHVGVAVPNVPEAAAYYTETMGFREAFRNTNDQGQPTSIYMQASRDTFVELQQANEQRPVGITHYGLVVDDISESVAMFRKRGATSTDPSRDFRFARPRWTAYTSESRSAHENLLHRTSSRL